MIGLRLFAPGPVVCCLRLIAGVIRSRVHGRRRSRGVSRFGLENSSTI